MTPTPPSATPSSQENYSPDGQYRVVRKRNRVPLSCAPCRNRKLKCNRSQPCENCVKRGDSVSCSYAAPGSRKKSSPASGVATSPVDMQNRIDRLEGLVLSLMTNGSQSAGPTAATRALSFSSPSSGSAASPQNVDLDGDDMIKDENEDGESETDQVSKSLGMMKVENNRSMYFGEAHWAAILNDIAEVKSYFADHKKQYEAQMLRIQASKAREDFSRGPTFLFGGGQLPDFEELLASLPAKNVTDKIVSRYFNDYDPAIHILHPPSWQRAYERHWKTPKNSSPAFLGQIFAILCLGMHSYHRGGDEPPEFRGEALKLASQYRALTAQCLLVADFVKPINSMIETLVLHLHGEYARSREAEPGIWVLIGMIVRLAMRMGYHRDPKYYPNITPFQGEIRRRVWTFVRQSDLLFSFQISLPSMIRLGDCDTELPRNLYDDEFDEDTKELPRSRPPSSPTPVSYVIAKAEIAFAFGKVVESLHAVSSCTYDDIITLDNNLRQAYTNTPPHLRLRPMSECMMDPAPIIMQRFNLSLLYNKGQCVLHRRFLARARDNPRYTHSRRTCVNSSMDLLNQQATLHYESGPGRRLHSMKWFINSLTTHDFLLAGTLVCLDLYYGAEAERAGRTSSDIYTWGLERRSEMIRAIEVSKDIWKELSNESMEAYKAAGILKVMLEKIKSYDNTPANNAVRNPFIYANNPKAMNGTPSYEPPENEKPEHSAAMTLGMLSSGGMTPNSASLFGCAATPGGSADMGNLQPSGMTPNFLSDALPGGAASASSPFPFMGNNGMDLSSNSLDWDAWDSYVQNATVDPQLWPANIDLPKDLSSIDGQDQAGGQKENSVNSGGGGSNAGVFMGVSTPPRNLGM